ncbi:MAG: hypothetical protein MZV70_32900 [Desulfobacterales bacterium]|nr:hypothetical protein [Desulfobacterales bacterium]
MKGAAQKRVPQIQFIRFEISSNNWRFRPPGVHEEGGEMIPSSIFYTQFFKCVMMIVRPL